MESNSPVADSPFTLDEASRRFVCHAMEPKHDRTNIRAKRQRGAETWAHSPTSGLAQFPDVIGGIEPGIEAGKPVLDSPTLARIFLGQITRWNDPAIAQINAGPTLSDARINGVHRAGGSGTT